MTAVAVELDGLTYRFAENPLPSLKGVSASFEEGKISGIVGPDGAGKTTLLRLLAGLLKPSEGSCKVLGQDPLQRDRESGAQIGYMPQQFGLYEELSLIQNLSLYADLYAVEDKVRRSEELLEFAKLSPFRDRLARQLSGGMRQKLGLICTLIGRPRLLFLDEPTVGLDPKSQMDLWRMIQELNQGGATVIWSSSNLTRAAQSDGILLLNHGEVLFQGPPGELTQRVEGRVFHLSGLGTKKRSILRTLVKHPSVVDVTLEGRALRVVLKQDSDPLRARDFGLQKGAELEPIQARLEDAFIDLLGGLLEYPSFEYRFAGSGLSEATPPVEAKSLTKRFGAFTAVSEVSFALKAGEIFGLLGPNGAGKSTTFKMLCGLHTATSGDPLINGRSLKSARREARKLIGYMAQSFSLYNNLTVLQNLRFFGGVYGVSNLKARIDELISLFRLDTLTDTLPVHLSLGFKQRLALSCAIIHRPPILFLDEPTSGVGPLTRREFWYNINTLTEQGVTVLVSTHLMDEAEFCDRIGFIQQGLLKVVDTPDNLRSRTQSKELPNPTLEDAFLALCRDIEEEGG